MAFIGISIALIFGEGYETADDWAALLASAFILYNSFLIFRPALGEIMDEHQYDDLIQEIRDTSMEVDGIIGTEKCFIRKSGMKYHVDLHAIVDGKISVEEGHWIAHNLKDYLRKEIPNLGHVLIHIEPDEYTYDVDWTIRAHTFQQIPWHLLIYGWNGVSYTFQYQPLWNTSFFSSAGVPCYSFHAKNPISQPIRLK